MLDAVIGVLLLLVPVNIVVAMVRYNRRSQARG